MTYWAAPFTGGGKAILPAGTVFTIARDPVWWAFAAECEPEDRDSVERTIVPEEDRRAESYAGFRVFIRLAAIRNRCDAL